MPYTIFDGSTYKDQRGHLWFDPEKWEPITASLACTFETVDATWTGTNEELQYTGDIDYPVGYNWTFLGAATQYNPDDREGDIAISLEQLTFVGAASWLSGDRTGDIDCSFVVLEATWTGANEEFNHFSCTAENLTASWAATTESLGTYIWCSGQEPTLRMQSGLHMDLSMRPWELIVEHARKGIMDNLVFKELEFEAYAMVDYVTLELETRKWTCEMGDAPEVDLTFEQFVLTGEMVSGHTGGIDAAGRRFEIAMTAGDPYNIDCEFEEPTLTATGDTPIDSSLNLTALVMQAEFAGTTPLAGQMDLRGMQWRLDAAAGFSGNRLGGISLNFRQLEITGTVDGGKVADIDSIFRDLLFKATAGTDGVDDLDLETLPPEIEMGSGGAMSGETCETADDLIFEETL